MSPETRARAMLDKWSAWAREQPEDEPGTNAELAAREDAQFVAMMARAISEAVHAERERCAKVAEAEAAHWWGSEYHSTPQQAEHAFKAECLEQLAKRIREGQR